MNIILLLVMMTILLIFPEKCTKIALDSLKIWGLNLVPSLFPYMVLCQSLCAAMKKNTRMLLTCAPIMGLIGGSPSGSIALSAGLAAIPRSARYVLSLCALSTGISPMFFLGPIASWLGTGTDASRLLIAHIAGSAAAAGLLLPFNISASHRSVVNSNSVCAQPNPLLRSVDAVLGVGACIVFYSVAAECVRLGLPFLSSGMKAMIHGLMEVSGGVRSIISLPLSREMRLLILSAELGFGGVSILNQNLIFLSDIGIRMKHLILIGLLRAFCSSLIMLILIQVS